MGVPFQSSTSEWHSLFGSEPPRQRAAILVAHPDDETLGAAAVLLRNTDVFVIYLTDGAPRDRSLWSSGLNCTQEEYAALRRAEAVAALAIASVDRSRIFFLNGVDQEAIYEIVPLTNALLTLLRRLNPGIVVTHPYEGGHPDHDAAALAARIAIDKYDRSAPQLIEMTSYHAHEGRCVTGEFLDANESTKQFFTQLSAVEIDQKKSMLDCYRSQQAVIEAFQIGSELYRVAPQYDFSHPPHKGPLWYERMKWPLSGTEWRELANEARQQVWICH